MTVAAPIPVHPNADGVQLCRDWIAAKSREEVAKAERVLIEERLQALVETKLPEEGSKTLTDFDGFKATFDKGVNRKLDLTAARGVLSEIKKIDPSIVPLKIKEEIDERGIRWLEEHRPDLYDLLKPHLTISPKKTGVKIVATNAD